MFFTIDGTLLLKKGLAETIYPKAGGKPVGDFIKDALAAGVRFTACTASTELHDLQPSDLIDGVQMVGGASMWQIADDCKTVLTF
jgi:predicted peroxiredoxin